MDNLLKSVVEPAGPRKGSRTGMKPAPKAAGIAVFRAGKSGFKPFQGLENPA
jgi:hypothetical protein